ncbi:Fis family transcriptional regulator, partial [Klebsiella pneumoniae]
DLSIEHHLYYPQTYKPRAFFTTCSTGLGAASNLSALLTAIIPQSLGFDLVSCDVETLAAHARRVSILSRYQFMPLVCTFFPHLSGLPLIFLFSLFLLYGS